ncbi:MAG: S9 family peptidase [Planctomycetes bacterium]|nr:S9 family peptidase [Planctomycetota bacterium]
MSRARSRLVLVLAVLLSGCAGDGKEPGPATTEAPDPWLWLEDVGGERSLAWVREQNAVSQAELEAAPEFEPIRRRLLEILDSRERIPRVSKRGPFFYNFWRDDANPRGVWRRTTLAEYRKPQPAWETVLDLDRLAAAENENWVWQGANFLEPDFDRCLLELSRGGADASVLREFDPVRKEFVTGGFALSEAKSWAAWKDRDTIYVGTDFGPGSLTTSGYTRVAKLWKRGTPLAEARTVFEGEATDVSVSVTAERDHGRLYELAHREPTFFTSEVSVRRGDAFVRVEKPADAEADHFDGFLLLRLRSDWTLAGRTWAAGSLLAADFEAWLKGGREVTPLFEPTARRCLRGSSPTRNYLILNVLDNVRCRPELMKFADGRWTREPLEAPDFGVADASGIDPEESDDYFLSATGFLTPSTLFFGTAGRPGLEKLRSLPGFFDTDGLEVSQFEAVSRDGTRIPYFQVNRRGLVLDGRNPALLSGYGGFEISLLPSYRAALGAAWLERGGVYALANIRGGGEFGPAWHNAARKENRQRAYDDFAAVAEDLAARRVTSPEHLGIEGRSNGGLLVGVMLTQRPDLFGAVVCGSPLLDMRAYTRLPAGASWIDEYGDPDLPGDWEFIRRFSPYHNLSTDQHYPRVLFTTSTRDDRVHPAHARKMFARMKEQGHDALYYENIEGGHGAAANNRQSAFMEALTYAFLWNELK